jgi:hypothetical protein
MYDVKSVKLSGTERGNKWNKKINELETSCKNKIRLIQSHK